SVANNSTHHYCHISFDTEEVLSVFPGEREEVVGVGRIGDSFVLSDRPRVSRVSAQRGRPPYPWDAFHIEVADLLRRNELPEKKESGIDNFQGCFQPKHGIRASRSVIGDKLKPYYDKFVKASGQKIG